MLTAWLIVLKLFLCAVFNCSRYQESRLAILMLTIVLIVSGQVTKYMTMPMSQ